MTLFSVHFFRGIIDDRTNAGPTCGNTARSDKGVAAGLEARGSAFFRSSAIVLNYPHNEQRAAGVQRIIEDAQRNHLGVLLLVGMDEALPQRGDINVVFERPRTGWKISLDLGHADLALLIGYKLKRNWETDLILTAALDGSEEEAQALDYLKAVAELARIPPTPGSPQRRQRPPLLPP